MRFLRYISLVLPMLFVFGKAKRLEKPVAQQRNEERLIADLLNTFTFNFQKHLAESEDGNLVFSPFSIYSGLGMLHLASNAETQKQIAKALEWESENSNSHTFLKSLQDLTGKLSSENDAGVTLNSAVNGWLSDDFNILKSFQTQMKQFFGVSFKRENFAQAESARTNINKWVSDHTGNRINDLFPAGAISSATKIVLANAVYFKGKWTSPFKKRHTSLQPFYPVATTGDGNTNPSKKVPFMYQSGNFLCGTYRNVQLLELPYGSEGEFTMLLARPLHQSEIWDQQQQKPNDLTDIKSLSKQINSSLIEQFQKSLISIKADVYLPKFTVKQKIDLRKQLAKLGIKNVFGKGIADLSPINGKKNLYVSSARHQAFVQVDEEGTEAAAATGFGIALLSMPPQIQFNRPFLFFIIHKPQNAVLFAGRVMDPGA